MQELVVGAALVVGERLAVLEAAPAIERQGGLVGGDRAGLQAEARQAAPPGLDHDMVEQGAGHAAAQMLRIGAHRLHLARSTAELLERPDTGQFPVYPRGPDGDVRLLQA